MNIAQFNSQFRVLLRVPIDPSNGRAQLSEYLDVHGHVASTKSRWAGDIEVLDYPVLQNARGQLGESADVLTHQEIGDNLPIDRTTLKMNREARIQVDHWNMSTLVEVAKETSHVESRPDVEWGFNVLQNELILFAPKGPTPREKQLLENIQRATSNPS